MGLVQLLMAAAAQGDNRVHLQSRARPLEQDTTRRVAFLFNSLLLCRSVPSFRCSKAATVHTAATVNEQLLPPRGNAPATEVNYVSQFRLLIPTARERHRLLTEYCSVQLVTGQHATAGRPSRSSSYDPPDLPAPALLLGHRSALGCGIHWREVPKHKAVSLVSCDLWSSHLRQAPRAVL